MSSALRNSLICLLLLLQTSASPSNFGVVQLLNGDRITGRIVSESAQEIVLATDWTPNFRIPQNQIRRMERLMSPIATATPPKPTTKPKPPPKPAPAPPKKPDTTPKPATKPTPKPKAKPTTPKPAPKPTASKSKPKPLKKSTRRGTWKHDLRLGLDLRYTSVTQQTVHSRLKSTYASKQFRNQIDWQFAYGRAGDVFSANRMSGLVKSDWTFESGWYVYHIGSAGYDIVRRIERQYEFGPGFGYHVIKGRKLLFKNSKFSLDLETGGEYEHKLSTTGRVRSRYFWRIGQVARWKINDDLDFTEEFEFFPRIGDLVAHRYRIEANLAYRLIKNLSLNFTVMAEADQIRLTDIEPDDLQFRSSLSWRF